MPNVRVAVVGEIVGAGVFDPGTGAPAGAWNDDSDATFSIGNTAGQLDRAPKVTRNAALARVFAHVRYSGAEAGGCQVVGDALGFDQTLHAITAPEPGGASATPTWMVQELGGDMENFLESLYDPSGASKFLSIGSSGGHIYEAYLIVKGPGESASCRGFPASTSTSVGGMVRGFPPSKFAGAGGRGLAGGHN